MSASGLGTGGRGCCNESSDQLASPNSSLSWLRLGGRHFDGAISYACDRGVGAAIALSGVPRREVFVASKVGPGGVPFALGYNETKAQAGQILADLRSDYVDLLLVLMVGVARRHTCCPDLRRSGWNPSSAAY